ncbi:hypothetical protein [Jiulongibacter sp. NS-SX5]|uniref:hypothetical protein n=1 Tax=Jiulongibacter sp. NS-SX5 TaxID=3463854 RepID=UPI0040598CFA
MIKKLLFRHIYMLLPILLFGSFVFLGSARDLKLEKNELAYANTKVSLNFGGLEEKPSEKGDQTFRTDIYLSDIDLNNSSVNAHEEVVLLLRNRMKAKTFRNGHYSISNDGSQSVKAEILSLGGKKIKVESGSVEYEGTYPQVHLTFDLNLKNGEKLIGSYYKEMQAFKYDF